MPKNALILFFDSAAFDIGNSLSNDRISVVARYGDRDLLRGGWLDGEKHLAQQAALLDVGYGGGRIVLVGFRPQNRTQAQGLPVSGEAASSYPPFIFNTLRHPIA